MKTIPKLEILLIQIERIIEKAEKLAKQYDKSIKSVHKDYRESALNLIHYLAFRSFDNTNLQQDLWYTGLPGLANIEGHVMCNLTTIRTIIKHLLNIEEFIPQKKYISIKKSEKLLQKNTKYLFGNKPTNRITRIQVTLPPEAAKSHKFIKKLVQKGMNIARINCAHGNEKEWGQMIENVEKVSKSLKRECKIMMDLGGPKLRTGALQPGPQVIRIKPHRDSSGKLIKPARVWIAPTGVPPPSNFADAIIPVSESFIEKIKKGNNLWFTDSRGKKREIYIESKLGKGRWGLCSGSAYIETGMELVLDKVSKDGKEKHYVGELLPVEQSITLHIGDKLILHSAPTPGAPAEYDSNGMLITPAHISCTLPEIFQYVKIGERVSLNDGKIEGIIEKVYPNEILLSISHASASGSKLRADKGINLPETILAINGLTEKDKQDLPFIAVNADAVNLSFVNCANDVKQLQNELKKYDEKLGIVLKIETRDGFKNLPEIMLQAMQTYPVGIMVARGDLAIETGWETFATIQEEIIRIGEAAHVPVIWATQVLESLMKKGIPTRSEITDAALAQRTECVMLNKGPYIEKTLKTLNAILVQMQSQQKKRQTMLPKLKGGDGLDLLYAEWDNLSGKE
jgi:pyruvate kinase